MTLPGQSVSKGSRDLPEHDRSPLAVAKRELAERSQLIEQARLDAAATAVQDAEVLLATASTLLGQTARKSWWYEVNKLYRDAHSMGEILARRAREAGG